MLRMKHNMPARLIGPRRMGGAFYRKRPAVRRPRGPKAVNRRVATVGTVKKLISKMVETKFITRNLETNVSHNSQISAPDMLPIVPTVNQGDDDFERVGDTIRPTKLNIRGIISMDRTNVSSNQVLLVRVLVLEPRNAKTYAVSVPQYPTYALGLLKPNLTTGTTTIPFVGNTVDLQYKPNPDLFRVLYDKVFKIAPTADGVEQNPSSIIRWSKNLKIPSKFDYVDGTNLPVNYNPFYCLGYVYADGTGPDVVATKIITQTDATLYYKDA